MANSVRLTRIGFLDNNGLAANFGSNTQWDFWRPSEDVILDSDLVEDSGSFRLHGILIVYPGPNDGVTGFQIRMIVSTADYGETNIATIRGASSYFSDLFRAQGVIRIRRDGDDSKFCVYTRNVYSDSNGEAIFQNLDSSLNGKYLTCHDLEGTNRVALVYVAHGDPIFRNDDTGTGSLSTETVAAIHIDFLREDLNEPALPPSSHVIQMSYENQQIIYNARELYYEPTADPPGAVDPYFSKWGSVLLPRHMMIRKFGSGTSDLTQAQIFFRYGADGAMSPRFLDTGAIRLVHSTGNVTVTSELFRVITYTNRQHVIAQYGPGAIRDAFDVFWDAVWLSSDRDLELHLYAEIPDDVPRAPDKVSSLAAEVRDRSYVLSWPWPDDNGSDITGFDLQRHSDTFGPGDGEEGIDAVNSYEVTDVTRGETYYPQIRAKNINGAGLWSRSTIAVPGGRPPGKITGITALGNDRAIVLLFPAPDEGDTLIGYYQYQLGDGNSWVDFVAHNQAKIQQRGTIGVPANGIFSVRLRAVNLTGAGPPSDTIAVETAIPSRLSRPTNVRWEITTRGPIIIWDSPSERRNKLCHSV